MSRRGHMSTKLPHVKLRPAPARIINHNHLGQTETSDNSSNKGKERALDEEDADSSFDISHAVVDLKPLRNAVVCLTGIKQQRNEIQEMAKTLGARVELALTTDTTHLIAEGVTSAKYKCAIQYQKHVMKPSFITTLHELWINGQGISPVDLAVKTIEHKLPAFHELEIAITAFPLRPSSIRLAISKTISDHGAKYRSSFDRLCSHLIVGPEIQNKEQLEANEKYMVALKFATMYPETCPKAVWSEWYDDCLAAGVALDEEPYLVNKHPRPLRRAVALANAVPGETSSRLLRQESHPQQGFQPIDASTSANRKFSISNQTPQIENSTSKRPNEEPDEELAPARKRIRRLDQTQTFEDHISSVFGQILAENKDSAPLYNAMSIDEQDAELVSLHASARESTPSTLATLESTTESQQQQSTKNPRKMLGATRSASFAAAPSLARRTLSSGPVFQRPTVVDVVAEPVDEVENNPEQDGQQQRNDGGPQIGLTDSRCDTNVNLPPEDSGFDEGPQDCGEKSTGVLSGMKEAFTLPPTNSQLAKSSATFSQQNGQTETGFLSGVTMFMTGYPCDANGQRTKVYKAANMARSKGATVFHDDEPPPDNMAIDWIVMPMFNPETDIDIHQSNVVSDAWLEQSLNHKHCDDPDEIMMGRPMRAVFRQQELCITPSGFDEGQCHILHRICRAAGIAWSATFTPETTCVIAATSEGEAARRAKAAGKMVQSFSWLLEHLSKGGQVVLSPKIQAIPEGPLSAVVMFISKKIQNSVGFRKSKSFVLLKQPERKDLLKLLHQLGGRQVLGYTTDTTHVLYAGDKSKLPAEIKKALAEGKHVVHPQWLEACMKEDFKVSERAFPFALQVEKALPMASLSQASQSNNRHSNSSLSRPPIKLISTLPPRSHFRLSMSPPAQLPKEDVSHSMHRSLTEPSTSAAPVLVEYNDTELQKSDSEAEIIPQTSKLTIPTLPGCNEAESLVTRLSKLVGPPSTPDDEPQRKSKHRKRPVSKAVPHDPLVEDVDCSSPTTNDRSVQMAIFPFDANYNRRHEETQIPQDSLRIAVIDPKAEAARALLYGTARRAGSKFETTVSPPVTRSKLY